MPARTGGAWARPHKEPPACGPPPRCLRATLVKRVIGLPGDKIKIDFVNGIVYRNGEALTEEYTNTPTNLPENFPINGEITVEEGKVFVLGDNRNYSKDSRSNQVGQVDMRYIMGKAYLRIWPLNALGTV